MDKSELSVAFAEERAAVFKRVYSLIGASDGPRALEAVETYVRLWDEILALARAREFAEEGGVSDATV